MDNQYLDLSDVKIRIAGMVADSIVDGPGMRCTIFTQGCFHRCHGCHNEHTWDMNGGYRLSGDILVRSIKENLGFSRAVTWSGGDPIYQAESLVPIVRALKDDIDNSMLFTGFEFDELYEYDDFHLCTLENKFIEYYAGGEAWRVMLRKALVPVYREDDIQLRARLDLLENMDLLCDGPFRQSKMKEGIRFRGSSNQHIYYRILGVHEEFDEVTDHYAHIWADVTEMIDDPGFNMSYLEGLRNPDLTRHIQNTH